MPHIDRQDRAEELHGWRSLLGLLSSVTAVQILGFALLPFLGRLYTKADYGILGTLMALVGVSTLLANGRYDMATTVAPVGGRLRLLRASALCLNLSLTLILTILALLAPSWLRGTEYEAVSPYLLIVPLTTCLSALFGILASGATAQGSYGRISLGSLLQGYINNALKVLCGWRSLGVWGFAIAFNTGMLVASGVLLWRRTRGFLEGVTPRRMLVAMWHYRNFPKFTIMQGMVVMLMANIMPLVLPMHYTPSEIGIITMLYMITRRPVQVYAEATGRVYARRLLVARERGESFSPAVRRLALRLLALSGVVFVGFWFFGEHLVSFILGAQWAELGGIIIWMIPFLLLEGLCHILGFVPDALGRQRHYLMLQSLRLVSQLTFILLAAPQLEFAVFIRAYFAYSSLEYLLVYLWLTHLVGGQSLGNQGASGRGNAC